MLRSTTLSIAALPRRGLAIRALLALGWLGLLAVLHAPTHLGSALGRLAGQPAWIDAARVTLPPALHSAFWIPPLLLLLGFALRNRGQTVAAPAAGLTPRDLTIALLVALVALAVRLLPLLREPWIKPDYDEGVYLGGAWLLRDGVLPYRDYVFAHLPGALLLLQPAAALIERGQDNAAALQAGRGIVALADSLAAGLIYLTARQLVATPGALLAALVYTSDALAIQFSRGVRLEPLQAPFLAAGALLLLRTLNQPRTARGPALSAGICLALGVAVKITGALAPIAALVILLLERRWRSLRDLVLGLALGALLICGWCVLAAGDEIVRQTVLLQLLRSKEYLLDPYAFLLSDRYTALTALAALLGCGALAWRAWRERIASGWLFVGLWLTLTLLLFATAASFYDHYYTQLVPPLALLAAALPGAIPRRRPARIAALAVALLLVPLLWGQARLWREVDRAAAQRPFVAALKELPPDAPVLLFDPIISVLAGRPIATAPGQPYMLDAFLGDPYLDSALNRRWNRTIAVREAVMGAVDYLLVDDADAARLPSLWRSFHCQPLTDTPHGLMRCARIDQPATLLHVGPQLELLRRDEARVQDGDGQRWLVQPLHWRAPRPPADDQALALHLLAADGTRVAQLDVPVNGGVAWQPDVITTLEYRIPLPTDLAPGRYRLTAAVYSWADGQIVPLQPASGGAALSELELPPVRIGP